MQKLVQKCAKVVKLDKSLPIISVDLTNSVQNAQKIRAEFNKNLSKKHATLAIGDEVLARVDESLENAIIDEILPRKTKLVRNDPVNRQKEQVLAANFTHIAICVAANQLNFNHLARLLVLACNTGVPVTLIFTKCDLCEPNVSEVAELVGGGAVSDIVATSLLRHSERNVSSPAKERGVEESLESAPLLKTTNLTTGNCCERNARSNMRSSGDPYASFSCTCVQENSAQDDEGESNTLHPLLANQTTVLLGKSGVGKSTLINALAGEEVCKRGKVREFDSKGRHTTVSREIIETQHFGNIVDMPGLRSLGLINCERGLRTVFSEICSLAKGCKFRDCQHAGEPGCAVRNQVSERLLASWRELVAENATNSCQHPTGGKSGT